MSERTVVLSTSERLEEMRESLYLLSTELVILYLAALGLMRFATGMGYAAVVYTSLLACLLPCLAVLLDMLGLDHARKAAVAGARGGAVFTAAGVMVLIVLVTSLWSSPLVCVYVNDSSTQCHTKGDSASQDVYAEDARFAFPSRAQYLEYMELANATVADIFLKTSLSENDYVTKIHAVVALPVILIIFVLQNSFFYAIYRVHTSADAVSGTPADVFTAADLFSLFVRCAVLLLCVVVDTTDLLADWNVVDVWTQMLPSFLFTSALVLADVVAIVLYSKAPVFVLVCGIMLSAMYCLCALVIACHYALGGIAGVRDLMVDTRFTTVHSFFIVFLVLDALCTGGGVISQTEQYRKKKKDGAAPAKAVEPTLQPAPGTAAQGFALGFKYAKD
jgi:hypothetical protein